MTFKVQINLRVDPKLAEELKNKAEEEHRSLNNLIEWLIIKYLNNEQ